MKPRSLIFLLWTLQALACLAWLALLPASAERGLLLGYSTSRLALMALMLALSAFSAALVRYQTLADRLFFTRLRPTARWLSVIAALGAPITILILRALGQTTSFTYTAYAGRLAPLAAWLSLSALELAALIAVEDQARQPIQQTTRAFLRKTLFSLAALAGILIFIVTTGMGITRYNDGSWGHPTTPLLEWQILLALAIGLTLPALSKRLPWLKKKVPAFLVIYALTCLLWLATPINPGYFATPPREPNHQIYPFSDALIYAQYAQSALVGNGFMWPDVPTRPLYITFITWLHTLAGQDYVQVIRLQTLVLAAFPAILYLLGSEIGGPGLGLGLALLAALRDLTANAAAPFALNYTYTKLFFSEIPAALLICLVTYMAIRWIRRPQPSWYALLAGGLLGLSALIRLQSVVVLAPVIPFGLFIVKDRTKWLVGSLLMVLGVFLALTPWLVRNQRATGGIVLDNPISQSMVLARRWSGSSGNELFPHLPGENDARYSSRMAGLALNSLRADPARILGSAVNHFFNNEISTLLVFPLRDQLDSPRDLLWPTRAFWQSWDARPGIGQSFLIGFYLLLLATGLAAAVQQNGLVGLLPLGLSLVYNAWTALFLSSGDRFLVPVDWAISLYLFLGLLTLGRLVTRQGLFSQAVEAQPANLPAGQRTNPWVGLAICAALIVLFGASLPLTEMVFPRQYTPANLPDSPQPVQVHLRGRAIYPRFYEAKDGEPGTAKLGYGSSDQARLVFFLVGEKNCLVLFPLQKAPAYFPHTAEVEITGILQDGYLVASHISLQKDGRSAEYPP